MEGQKNIIREGLKHNKPPRAIRRDVNSAFPDDIVDLKVVQNAVYNFKSNNRPENERRQNVADDVLSILNKLYSGTYVKEVIATGSNKPPNVICYTTEQIRLLKSAILSGCIIGIDRTFNVSPHFLTTLCFKNPNVVQKRTQDSPIMLGPIFLHWDGKFETYQRFMSHIQTLLVKLPSVRDRHTDVSFTEVIFGTDGECHLVNAINACFPQAVQTLCTKHLKDNTRFNLRKTFPNPVVEEIFNKIFHPQNGLLSTTDRHVYNEKESELKDEFACSYLTDTLLPTLRSRVFEPRLKCPNIPKLWTNNNNESYNNKIKQETGWTILRTPDLIDILETFEIEQVAELRGALYGKGNYELTEAASVLRVSNKTWGNLAEPQQKSRLQRLFCSITSKFCYFIRW